MMRQKLHILFLPYWFPSKINPKNGNFILRHAQAVATLHEVSVLFIERNEKLNSEFEISEDKENNLFILRIYYKGNSCKLINAWKKYKAYNKGLQLIAKFDIIHIHVLHYYAILACYFKLKKKINFVVTEHWSRWITEDLSLSRKFYNIIMKLICSQASYILPVSSDLGINMRKKGIKGNFISIPNVVNTEIFKPSNKKNKKNVFLHISNLANEYKNIIGILNVSKRLADSGYRFILQIGGDGDNSVIKEFIKNNKLENYIFTFGALSEVEVSNKMKNADAFVMFSNKESQPCVINEAFSCGLPVISTNVGGISELFPSKFGILIEKGNENQLYEAMERCIKGTIEFAEADVMHQFSEKHFSIKNIAKKFDKIYTHVMH
ncbi:MAG: glycosyltransferase [Apibacter sp.]|nr:glycosyltransferase [Apibacter sp.]